MASIACYNRFAVDTQDVLFSFQDLCDDVERDLAIVKSAAFFAARKWGAFFEKKSFKKLLKP